jgi:group I intron endonuclease
MKNKQSNKPAIVYIVINLINNKRYIGVTTRTLRKRINEHFCHARNFVNNGSFYRALRKYSRDCFEFSILATYDCCYDAIKAEIKFIAELHPEYNSTKGGDGRPWPRSKDERKKIGDFHRGNKYCLGKTHNEETKKLLSDINKSPKHRKIWLKNGSLGPISVARKVKCLDDNMEFESASAAARHYMVSRSALIELCLGKNYRKTVNGLRFEYVIQPNAAGADQ